MFLGIRKTPYQIACQNIDDVIKNLKDNNEQEGVIHLLDLMKIPLESIYKYRSDQKEFYTALGVLDALKVHLSFYGKELVFGTLAADKYGKIRFIEAYISGFFGVFPADYLKNNNDSLLLMLQGMVECLRSEGIVSSVNQQKLLNHMINLSTAEYICSLMKDPPIITGDPKGVGLEIDVINDQFYIDGKYVDVKFLE